jgi:hypothetical protein
MIEKYDRAIERDMGLFPASCVCNGYGCVALGRESGKMVHF